MRNDRLGGKVVVNVGWTSLLFWVEVGTLMWYLKLLKNAILYDYQLRNAYPGNANRMHSNELEKINIGQTAKMFQTIIAALDKSFKANKH